MSDRAKAARTFLAVQQAIKDAEPMTTTKLIELYPELVKEIVNEALTAALHPEFGYEWREPMPDGKGGTDGGGAFWQAMHPAGQYEYDVENCSHDYCTSKCTGCGYESG